VLDTVVSTITAGIVAVISAAGYLGVVALMAVESACIPLPSEIILPFAGYLVSIGRLGLVGVATAGAVGCNLGSTLAYMIGAYGGRPAVERWGSYVLMRPGELARLEQFFAKYGNATVFVARLLPVVRTFISLPAGLSRMPLLRFQIYTFVGSWPWCYALAYLGFKLGERWDSDPRLRYWFHQLDGLILLSIAAAVGWYLWRRLRPHADETSQ
jgi:membrane protein DedA with SNARE-associated domain